MKTALVTFASALVLSPGSDAACPPEGTDVASLSVDSVLETIDSWGLSYAFGAEFKRQQVDGFQLLHINKDTVDPSAYPNAQPFHWSALWTRMKNCGFGGPSSTVAVEKAPLERRKLSSSDDSASGLHIKSNNSAIILGPSSDIELRRESDNVLGVHNHLRFCDGNGITFCNLEGEDVSLTSDMQGNVYANGDFHFLGNVTFEGVHFEQYVTNVFDKLTANTTDVEESCAAILLNDAAAKDGVYELDPDGPGGYDPMYAYCDMTNGGWTLLARYDNTGYMSTFNFGEAMFPTSTGGSVAPTNQIWCPMPSGEDDGHLPLLAFNVTGTRLLKAVCDASGDTYSYTSRLVDSWDGGVYGEDQGSGTTSDPVGWVILAGNDVGLEGRSHHYICGSVDYSGSRGFGFCSGEGASSSWTPHLASVSMWPSSIAIGCAGSSGDSFELWIK